MVREIVRQGLLIAAREHFKLATRDASLREPFPVSDDKAIVPVVMYRDKELVINFKIVEGDFDWNYAINCVPENNHRDYLVACRKVSALIDNQFKRAIRDAGYEPVKSANAETPSIHTAQQNINDLDLISQFIAVRAAHTGVLTCDPQEQAQWRSVLIRAYSHLALLTQHHWGHEHEVFAARALVYADLWMERSDSSDAARWHRAYARTLVGYHAGAIEDLQALGEIKGPKWSPILLAASKFDRVRMDACSKELPNYRPLVQRLRFELERSTRLQPWLVAVCADAVAESPEDYGVYCYMAKMGELGVSRSIAWRGIEAYSELLPDRLWQIEALEPRLKDYVSKRNGLKRAARLLEANWSNVLADSRYSRIPAVAAKSLIAMTKEDRNEPSWSILGNTLSEEQFALVSQAVDAINDATESDNSEEIGELVRLIPGHRFSPYIKAQAIPRGEMSLRWKLIQQVRVSEPRGNMASMFINCWELPLKPLGFPGGQLSQQTTGTHNASLPTMIEAFYDGPASHMWHQMPGNNQMHLETARLTSPHSPFWLRMEMIANQAPDADTLADWEEFVGTDPHNMSKLGEHFGQAGEFEKAIRYCQSSYDLYPSYPAANQLADAYLAQGNDEKFVEVLTSQLAQPTLGLSQGRIHEKLAHYYMRAGKRKESLPHANKAAETWAGWGLIIGAHYNEYAGKFDKAAYWYKEMAESYPTSSAMEWYFFCKRNSHKDLELAREFALRHLQGTSNAEWKLYYDMLEEHHETSLPALQEMAESTGKIYWYFHLSLLAEKLKNNEVGREAWREAQALADELDESSLKYRVMKRIHKMLVDGLDKEELNELWDDIHNLDDDDRCNFQYFAGELMYLMGNKEDAVQIWKNAIQYGPYTTRNATFAGWRLCEVEKEAEKTETNQETEPSTSD